MNLSAILQNTINRRVDRPTRRRLAVLKDEDMWLGVRERLIPIQRRVDYPINGLLWAKGVFTP